MEFQALAVTPVDDDPGGVSEEEQQRPNEQADRLIFSGAGRPVGNCAWTSVTSGKNSSRSHSPVPVRLISVSVMRPFFQSSRMVLSQTGP